MKKAELEDWEKQVQEISQDLDWIDPDDEDWQTYVSTARAKLDALEKEIWQKKLDTKE
jgi:hypothetical protein